MFDRAHRIAITALLFLALAPCLCAETQESDPAKAIDQAFHHLYNFEFAKVYAVLDDQERRDPGYPITYSVRGAATLFRELYRLGILETEFFSNDDKVTDTKLKPDPAVREQIFRATGDARRTGEARLAANPNDRDAMLALCIATGVETDYTILVEKKYFRSFALSRQSQQYAHRLLSLNPPVYDAYLTLGTVEYVVGSMNFFFRLFVRFDQIKGSRQQGAEHLKKVIAHGRYYPGFAKILLAVIYLRDKQPELALPLLTEMARDYPQNPLIRNEVARVTRLVAANAPKAKGAGN
jgi:hypothetical protein